MNSRLFLTTLLAGLVGFAGFLVFTENSERFGVALFPDPPVQGNGVEPPTDLAPPRVPVADPIDTDPGGETPPPTPTIAVEPPTDAEAEPSLKELEEYRAHVEVGRLAGVVLAGRAACPGVIVHAWEDEAGSTRGDTLAPPPGAWTTSTTDDGGFVFEGLAAGRYRVRVDLGRGAAREVPCEIKDGLGSKRIVIVVGAGAIAGRVVDEEGEPLPDALVSASALGPWIGGEGRIALARTDVDGNYELPGLFAGSYWLVAQHDALPNGKLDDHPQVRINAGERLQVDLGRAVAATWSGTVVDVDGNPIAGPRLIVLRKRGGGVERRFATDAGGRFHESVPAGIYDIFVGFMNEVELPGGMLQVQGNDVTGDVVCATRPLVLTATCLDCQLSGTQVVTELAKHLVLVPATGSGPSWRAELPRESGVLRFFGLPPGEYRIEVAAGFTLEDGDEPLWIAADEPTPERHLTLVRQ